MKKAFIISVFFCFFLLLNGFAPRTMMIELDEGSNGKTVQLQFRQQLEITLNANPTTGYSWAIDKLDRNILEPLGDFRMVNATERPVIKPVKPGIPVIKPVKPGLPGIPPPFYPTVPSRTHLPSNKLTGDFQEAARTVGPGGIYHGGDGTPPVAVGVGGAQELTLKALGKGKTEVVLVYRRPWEKGSPPAKLFRLTVVVE